MANLLHKASIITTPTAYGVGVLNSIKPAIPFGEELISNGDFSNGSTGWTIINGTVTDKYNASMTAYQSGIRITPFSYTGTFKVVFDLVITSGNCKFDAGGGNDEIYTTSGTKEKIITNPTKFEFNAFNLGWVGTLDNVSVKEMIDADFDFTRTSSAVRVDPDYLLETVSINSANLVQNGNFSELSSELIVNGNYDNTSDWTISGGNAEISNGKLNFNNAANYGTSVSNSASVVSGKTYLVEFTISDYSSGAAQIRLGSQFGTSRNANGTYTEYIVANATLIRLYPSSDNTTLSIDNVSVKQVDPNDNWDLGTGWSYGTNEVIGDGTSFTYITQSTVAIQNKKVKLTFDILDYVSGTFRLLPSDRQDGLDERFSGNGSYEVIYTSTVNLFRLQQQAFNGSITNISVIEIQENGVPRLDYTNGTASILLEPQSTNLIPYSEDFANGSTNSILYTANTTETISPSGNNTADKFEVTVSDSDANARFTQTTAIQSFTLSVYVKGNIGQKFELFLARDSFAELKNINVTLSGGWQRIVLSDSFSTTSSSVVIGYEFGFGSSDSVAGQVYYLWGSQLEVQSFATSYIPTNGSTVTRAAETLNNAANSDLINSTEGVLYADISALSEVYNSRRFITLNDGGSSNTIVLRYEASGIITARYQINGVAQCSISFATTITNTHKVAFKYKQNDFALWVDGTEVGTDTTGNILNADTINKISFDSGNGTFPFYGKCKTVAVFKEALSDTELACLTSTTDQEIFFNYYYRMQYVGADMSAIGCAERTYNI